MRSEPASSVLPSVACRSLSSMRSRAEFECAMGSDRQLRQGLPQFRQAGRSRRKPQRERPIARQQHVSIGANRSICKGHRHRIELEFLARPHRVARGAQRRLGHILDVEYFRQARRIRRRGFELQIRPDQAARFEACRARWPSDLPASSSGRVAAAGRHPSRGRRCAGGPVATSGSSSARRMGATSGFST